MAHPFRFGVSVPTAASAQEWRELARKAEDLGYDTFLVADHLRNLFQPMVALAFAADATSRIRLGTMVINNDFRHPVLLAREAATLDVLSGGRFELGIGAGHSGDEYREAGLPFDRPQVRVERLAESVRLMKQLWSGESVTFEGGYYQVTSHESYPRPAQPKLPIAVGGNARSVLELAAREADIVGFTGFFPSEDGRGHSFPHFSAERLQERIEIVRAAAGDRFSTLELNVLVQGVELETPEPVIEGWVSQLGISAGDVRESPFALFGSIDQLEEKLLAQRERLGISYITVFWPALEKLAPLIARLAGR
jgi:probable F420-dependent oxidoreductase